MVAKHELVALYDQSLSVAKHEPVALYDQTLSNFVAMAADDFEMLVCCARRLSDFCGMQGRGVHVTGVSAAYTFKLK
jgi:hypothetical protein